MTIVLSSEYIRQAFHYLRHVAQLFFQSYDRKKPSIEYPMIKVFDKGVL